MVLVLSLALPAAGAQTPPTQSADEDAIRAVVRNYVNARELRDAAAIDALFTPDADQHTTSGEWRRGRQAVIRGSLESSKANPGNRTIRVETIRLITSDVAIADGPYEIRTGDSVRKMWTTFVLERGRDGWRIAAIRNMLPAAPAQPR